MENSAPVQATDFPQRFVQKGYQPKILKHVLRNPRAAKVFIQTVYSPHLDIGELKVKNLAVALDTVFLCRFGNDGDSLLDCPAKSHLSGGFLIFGSDLDQGVFLQIGAAG